jgi:hypothetical protein
VASNGTVESPNFEKISKEAGQFTSDAINLLWAALNATRADGRRDSRRGQELLEPKVLHISPSANQDNLDTESSSVISFEGSSAVNLTGLRAPETNKTRLLFIQINGSATITIKHNTTSETANQIVLSGGADLARATGSGLVLAYLSSKWRQVV